MLNNVYCLTTEPIPMLNFLVFLPETIYRHSAFVSASRSRGVEVTVCTVLPNVTEVVETF